MLKLLNNKMGEGVFQNFVSLDKSALNHLCPLGIYDHKQTIGKNRFALIRIDNC